MLTFRTMYADSTLNISLIHIKGGHTVLHLYRRSLGIKIDVAQLMIDYGADIDLEDDVFPIACLIDRT